ncbi:hypothetical protein IG631_02117 [Alternaria alternata]|nr:hypothetical protein IG631_02117 [Alternaria alternata]
MAQSGDVSVFGRSAGYVGIRRRAYRIETGLRSCVAKRNNISSKVYRGMMNSLTPTLYQLLNAPLADVCARGYSSIDKTIQLPILCINHDATSENGLQHLHHGLRTESKTMRWRMWK